MSHAVERIAVFFETLTPQSVERFNQFYTEDAYFKDPFNEVRGVPAIQHIFQHMFQSLDEPHFVVTSRVVDGEQVFLGWDFHFRFRNFKTSQLQTIRGASHLRLAQDGRIRSHRDYWDAAEELYEKLPLVGGLMRWLKKRANS
ncbi:MAG: nuclear transport factor 2 family protein [Hylemonella sp.]|nr:nuclear transport factor 2 family protein [Hylemonella sp.]